jgi:hypothetical protein
MEKTANAATRTANVTKMTYFVEVGYVFLVFTHS